MLKNKLNKWKQSLYLWASYCFLQNDLNRSNELLINIPPGFLVESDMLVL